MLRLSAGWPRLSGSEFQVDVSNHTKQCAALKHGSTQPSTLRGTVNVRILTVKINYW